MIGRPLMYGLGVDSHPGLIKILQIIENELSTALGLVGLTDIKYVSRKYYQKIYLKILVMDSLNYRCSRGCYEW